MSEIINKKAGEIKAFDPKITKAKEVAHDAAIRWAATIDDQCALDKAVGEKIDEQVSFVAWWDGAVRPDGRPSGKTVAGPQQLSVAQAQQLTKIRKDTVSRWRKAHQNRDKYHEAIVQAALRRAYQRAAENHLAKGTGENEWYTPPEYIDAARKVMGAIDLDPATSEIAQSRIQAQKFFTLKDDGLKQKWEGRVWLNPPYAQPHIWDFCEKLVRELTEGNVSEAIMLTHNSTDTLWFHRAEEIAVALCFTKGRIKFVDAQGGTCAPTQGQTFFYFGPNKDAFAGEFLQYGFIR